MLPEKLNLLLFCHKYLTKSHILGVLHEIPNIYI